MFEASNVEIMILYAGVLCSKADIQLGPLPGCGEPVQLDLPVHQHSVHIIQVDTQAGKGQQCMCDQIRDCWLSKVHLVERDISLGT